ncbi:neuroendocrine convertase 2 [Sphaerodactylus townsendi]|uniref:neuroendocrine convertase 2 n=1 Tax=Sphaerodactylus townsendi TaxID=933632 RepID=UPI0020267395|nr:neuroendocrine convertase 2 [Sphaerodactylus townsendi]
MKADPVPSGKTAGLFFLGLLCLALASERAVYTNHFLVEIHKGAEAEAKQLAAEYGFSGVRKLPFVQDGYHFYHNGLPKIRRRRSAQHQLHLEKDPRNAPEHHVPSMPQPRPHTGMHPGRCTPSCPIAATPLLGVKRDNLASM